MSASLVGSEMCIRDSPQPLSVAAQPEGGAAHGSLAPANVEEAHAPADAVSYTHLTLPTICSV
eukprot:1105380-Alexandrium_andersonii.AAC.1